MNYVLALILVLTGVQTFAADLDAETALRMIETRQSAVKQMNGGKILSIEAMGESKGATLYRVNVKYGKSEQTYQLRYPQKSRSGLSDVLWTTHITSQQTTAKDVKLTESELAEFVQIASDEGLAKVRKEFPNMKITGLYTFARGERFKEPKAVILTFQVFYKGMQVPLLRRVYVQRESRQAEVGYDD